jgi:hypothetical protein
LLETFLFYQTLLAFSYQILKTAKKAISSEAKVGQSFET